MIDKVEIEPGCPFLNLETMVQELVSENKVYLFMGVAVVEPTTTFLREVFP